MFHQTAKAKCQLTELFASRETNRKITNFFNKNSCDSNKMVSHLSTWPMLTSRHVTDKFSQEESGVTTVVSYRIRILGLGSQTFYWKLS